MEKHEVNVKRRGKLKPAMREAFNTIKYFTELIHPGSVEPKPVSLISQGPWYPDPDSPIIYVVLG